MIFASRFSEEESKETMRDKQFIHDTEQALRRTKKQNEAIVRICTEDRDGGPSLWGYSDIPPEGGPVTLYRVSDGKTWLISKTGKVTEVESDADEGVVTTERHTSEA